MAYVSKTWVDRDSQYPTRRVLVHADLSEEQVTVRRDEGIITTQGDVFDANTMNNLEARIAAGIGEKQNTLTAGSGISIENDVISATGGGGGSSTLAGLDDTNISSPTNGQALIYDATSSKWVNANGGSGSATLAGLTDVTLTTPTVDQVLKYDGTKWVNGAGTGGNVEIEKTVSGSIASFSDGSDGLPMKSVVCSIVASQSGTGDPSPSNVRPISGYTGLNLTRAGKNLLGGSKLLSNAQEYLPSGTTDLTAKTFAFASSATSDGETFFTGDLTDKFKGNTVYTIIVTLMSSASSPRSNMRVYYTDGTYSAITSPIEQYAKETIVFTTNGNKTVSKITKYTGSGTTTLYYDECGVFEGTLTASQFEAYNATTYPVTWQTEAGTVYGGSPNITTGVLTKTYGSKLFSDLSWTKHSSYTNTYYADVPDIQAGGTSTLVNAICSAYIAVTRQNQTQQATNYSFSATSQNNRIFVIDDSYSTLEDFETGTANYRLVYELATPVTYQLTPMEVTSLLGTNNIWHDANGDTTVTYYTETASQILDIVQENTGIEELNNVSVLNVSNGQVLKYNSTSQKWENANESGGGGGAVIDDTTTALDKVWSSSKVSTEFTDKKVQILVSDFNPLTSYLEDAICIYNGQLYMAIDYVPAGQWFK